MLLRWLFSALALLLVAYFVPGFQVDSFWWALVVALVLGLVNATIRPVLLLLTLPINILTLGLFTFVINALMIMLVSTLLEGFQVADFTTALIAALILWLLGFVVDWFTVGREN